MVTAQLFRQWHELFPPALTGFIAGRGPVDAAYRAQWLLEQAHLTNLTLSGVSLDLIKCFNTIRRQGAFCILTHLGGPMPHPKKIREFPQ